MRFTGAKEMLTIRTTLRIDCRTMALAAFYMIAKLLCDSILIMVTQSNVLVLVCHERDSNRNVKLQINISLNLCNDNFLTKLV